MYLSLYIHSYWLVAFMILKLLESLARLSVLVLAAVVRLHRLCVLHLVVLMLASRLHSSSVLLGTLAETIARTFRLPLTGMVSGDRLPGLGFFFNFGLRSLILTTYTLEWQLGRSVCHCMQRTSLVTDLQLIKQTICFVLSVPGSAKKTAAIKNVVDDPPLPPT